MWEVYYGYLEDPRFDEARDRRDKATRSNTNNSFRSNNNSFRSGSRSSERGAGTPGGASGFSPLGRRLGGAKDKAALATAPLREGSGSSARDGAIEREGGGALWEALRGGGGEAAAGGGGGGGGGGASRPPPSMSIDLGQAMAPQPPPARGRQPEGGQPEGMHGSMGGQGTQSTPPRRPRKAAYAEPGALDDEGAVAGVDADRRPRWATDDGPTSALGSPPSRAAGGRPPVDGAEAGGAAGSATVGADERLAGHSPATDGGDPFWSSFGSGAEPRRGERTSEEEDARVMQQLQQEVDGNSRRRRCSSSLLASEMCVDPRNSSRPHSQLPATTIHRWPPPPSSVHRYIDPMSSLERWREHTHLPYLERLQKDAEIAAMSLAGTLTLAERANAAAQAATERARATVTKAQIRADDKRRRAEEEVNIPGPGWHFRRSEAVEAVASSERKVAEAEALLAAVSQEEERVAVDEARRVAAATAEARRSALAHEAALLEGQQLEEEEEARQRRRSSMESEVAQRSRRNSNAESDGATPRRRRRNSNDSEGAQRSARNSKETKGTLESPPAPRQ